jgi:hypothetical protein
VADNDPFSLGDSDEEKDAKVITLKDEDGDSGSKDEQNLNAEDEQVRKATEEAMAESIGGTSK